MSRFILFTVAVALVAFCASSASATTCTIPGQYYDECPDVCDKKCAEALTPEDDCLARFCIERCVCPDGLVESKDRRCIRPEACERQHIA